MKPPVATVIIPARNEAGHIIPCLDALAAQNIAADLAVIVVDNASTDATPALVQDFARTHPQLRLKLIAQTTPGRGATRAAGFAAATTELQLSTDADTIVPPDWAKQLVTRLSNPRLAAVTGTCRINDCSPFTNRTFNFFQPVFMRLYRIFVGHYWLTGSNFGIKRSAYLKAGGFDPHVSDLEDIEFSFRVAKTGPILFLRTPPVLTAGDRFAKGALIGSLPYASIFIQRFIFKRNASRD